jgi:predicted RNA-binding protein associated with RNAse of E/G family
MAPGDAHTVEVFWNLQWELLGWYVNLQAPLQVNGRNFDTADWALDITADPNGGWRWKDEDDFAEAVELGILDSAQAAEVRAEGERVAAARPWPTGWEGWRPPADWTPLILPAGWDVVEGG